MSNVIDPLLAIKKPADLDYNEIRASLIDNAKRQTDTSVSAVRSHNNGKGNGRKQRKDVTCSFCERKGHEEPECYQKRDAAKVAKEKAKEKKEKKGKGKDKEKSGQPSSSASVSLVVAVGSQNSVCKHPNARYGLPREF